MRLGIDASNIRAGGGLTHLVALLRAGEPQKYGFEQVIVWCNAKTINKIEKIHEAQLLNYLKATGFNIGLLVNFKHEKAEIKRMVLNLPERV